LIRAGIHGYHQHHKHNTLPDEQGRKISKTIDFTMGLYNPPPYLKPELIMPGVLNVVQAGEIYHQSV
jgi:hypothetical protein